MDLEHGWGRGRDYLRQERHRQGSGDPRVLILGSTTASSFLSSQKVREGRTVPRDGDTHRCHTGNYAAQPN